MAATAESENPRTRAAVCAIFLEQAHRKPRAQGSRLRTTQTLAPSDYLVLDDAPKEFSSAPSLLPRLIASDPARGLDDPSVIRISRISYVRASTFSEPNR